MTTHLHRFGQAHHHAVRLANFAYDQGRTNEERSDLYFMTYQSELAAFEKLEALRQPHPHQGEIDAQSAELLRH
jgi:hypothetical protein